MNFDNMMDYLECADANGYDVDDNFNLISRFSESSDDSFSAYRFEPEWKNCDIYELTALGRDTSSHENADEDRF